MGRYNVPPEVKSKAIDLSLITFVGKSTRDGAQYTMTSTVNEFCENILYQYLGGKRAVQKEVLEYIKEDYRADPKCGNWVWTIALRMVMIDTNDDSGSDI